MPIPALIGLPALGAVLYKLFDKAVDLIFSTAAKRLAIITIVIAGIYAALNTLLAIVEVYAKPLLSSLPSEVTALTGAVLPSNTGACVTAIIATELAALAYRLTIKALEMQTKVVG